MRRAVWSVGLVAALAVALTGMGCTTTAKSPSDSEIIASTMNTWLDGMKRKDVNAMLAVMADDFKSDMNSSKAEFKSSMEGFVSSGRMDNIKLDAANAAISIQGETATYEPVTVSMSEGSAGMAFSLKKSGGNWLISGLTIDY